MCIVRAILILSAACPAWAVAESADLAVVLDGVVDAEGRVDATALAVHRPRLGRYLAHLASAWPDALSRGQSAERLARLYNARAGWSLELAARSLRPLGGRGDAFALPESVWAKRLFDAPFRMDGRQTTLREIDRQLAEWDDGRVAASAPCVSDLFGPMIRRPFTAGSVDGSVAERFAVTVNDPERLVIDHDRRRLSVPAGLWRVADRLIERFERRCGTRDAGLVAALAEGVDASGRDRLADAMGYRLERRSAKARWMSRVYSDRQIGRRFGPEGVAPCDR